MSFDDEFFRYTPTSLGVVIDVGRRKALSFSKGALVQFIESLESDTEDKVFVYTKPVTGTPKSLGGSVGLIANYKDTPITLDVALKCALDALAKTDPESRRTILYFTDRPGESQARRFRRIVDMSEAYEMGVRFVVFNLGHEMPDVEKECQETGSAYVQVDPAYMDVDLLKEFINV